IGSSSSAAATSTLFPASAGHVSGIDAPYNVSFTNSSAENVAPSGTGGPSAAPLVGSNGWRSLTPSRAWTYAGAESVLTLLARRPLREPRGAAASDVEPLLVRAIRGRDLSIPVVPVHPATALQRQCVAYVGPERQVGDPLVQACGAVACVAGERVVVVAGRRIHRRIARSHDPPRQRIHEPVRAERPQDHGAAGVHVVGEPVAERAGVR